ncbi:nicotinate-nucleotide adenylyltransferase [Flavobacteriaceae bacterium TP-CH-4]|uniref:Nicotinate-nucleotide adenylyltransferase n=1 Tax=Pelagihabitans pacificus TaxID=2696054 RepID=A0A967EDV4_9FLAO|nr:nicotinate-nucleotide adenylyltransferase [Pelagihabitans pacificus]NHF59733.1 nicotinate-nucleotide adenylyltransferase [Pelagihabitans pacificus]
MRKVLLGLIAIGLTLPIYSQITETTETEKLTEVTVYATNYKYLQNVKTEQAASIPVKMLERKVAEFDVKNSDYYEDEYDFYEVNFYIPEGTILAAYDKDGKLLRTVERFNNVNLPKAVQMAVLDRFPEWTITKDVYLVDYHEHKGVNKKYKLKLENGDQILRVKMSENGEFL